MKQAYFLSVLIVTMVCSMTVGTITAQAEAVAPPAYTLMTQAPWEVESSNTMEGEESPAEPAMTTKPFRQLVDEAKTTYMEETPDLYTRGHEVKPSAGTALAPTPSWMSNKRTTVYTTTNTLIMPKHSGKLKPLTSSQPTKRPVTPDHTPWKEMRAFDRGGDFMFY